MMTDNVSMQEHAAANATTGWQLGLIKRKNVYMVTIDKNIICFFHFDYIVYYYYY